MKELSQTIIALNKHIGVKERAGMCHDCPYNGSEDRCFDNVCSDALKYLEDYKVCLEKLETELMDKIANLKCKITQMKQNLSLQRIK